MRHGPIDQPSPPRTVFCPGEFVELLIQGFLVQVEPDQWVRRRRERWCRRRWSGSARIGSITEFGSFGSLNSLKVLRSSSLIGVPVMPKNVAFGMAALICSPRSPSWVRCASSTRTMTLSLSLTFRRRRTRGSWRR